MKKIYLKKNKEKPLLHRHPWVFSGAIGRIDPDIDDGELVSLCDSKGQQLAAGYYNSRTPIAARALTFGDEKVSRILLQRLIISAMEKRRKNPLLCDTDAWRIIFSEGDFLPGLIVDSYGEHLAVQFITMGMDRLREEIISIIIDFMNPASIYERSEHDGRALEGLDIVHGQVYGTTPEETVIREGDLSFLVDIRSGQKTGFYLDQRDNRRLVKQLSLGRKVLNLFSYSGGFSAAALKGGASQVISVDASPVALDLARKNIELNGPADNAEYVRADIFQYLRDNDIMSDLIIIDPPALAGTKAAVDSACRGYKDLNLQVMKKCPLPSLILTCSCSRFISMDLFQKVIFSAAADAGRNVSIIGRYGHPADHPVSIYCPETEYLKSLLLYVN